MNQGEGEKSTHHGWGNAARPAWAHLPHAPHDAELLRVDEALQHDPDGHVHVVLQDIVPQMHLCVSLGHADHGLDVADRDGNAARSLSEGTNAGEKAPSRIFIYFFFSFCTI